MYALAGLGAALDATAPCPYVGQLRSPIDKDCGCPPGYHVDPSPSGTTCIRFTWFPNCVDAMGKSVPNCFFGYDRNLLLVSSGVGALAGLALGWLLAKVV